jgi:hypothetical protein
LRDAVPADIYDFVNLVRKRSRGNRGAAVRHAPLRDVEQKFVQEFASMLAPWGLPPSAGHVFGYLLLKQTPVSLDQIAADLAISKAGSWNAARLLLGFGHIRRYGVPGSKRALYAPSDNFAAPLLEQAALLGGLAGVLQRCASTVAKGQAATRLRERARFYVSMRDTLVAAIEELKAHRESS